MRDGGISPNSDQANMRGNNCAGTPHGVEGPGSVAVKMRMGMHWVRVIMCM